MLSTDKQTQLNERKKHRAQELLQLALRHAKSGNWGQTRYYLKSKCKHTKRHCYWYGRWIHNSLRILKQACQSGDSVGCYWSSAVTKRGHTPAYFFKRAAPFYRQACKQGDSRGCIALAKAARLPPRTKQTSKDYLESSQHQWLKRACQLRSPRGCLLLGRFRQTHLGKMYRETALASYRKACQLYEPVGCIEWGQLLRSLPALRHKAKQAFAMACRQHMPQGCKLAKQTTHAR
jgi:TPR repeat protein